MSTSTDLAALKGTIALPIIIAETINLQRNGKSWTAPCPFHAERTPSFHVFKDHYHCFGCGAHGDAFDWLEKQRGLSLQSAIEHLGGNREAAATPPRPAPASPVERLPDETMLLRRRLARAIWDEATDPIGSPVERYLGTRGVFLPDADVIRFHPRCPREGGTLPAMVALMTEPSTDEFRGVHRTFLRSDGSGKADVDKPRMMVGSAGTVQLVDLHEIGAGLGLAEGIETALSVMQAIGWGPVWAAGSAGAIRKFPFMRATTLNIFSDRDEAGLDAARGCSERWLAAGAEDRTERWNLDAYGRPCGGPIQWVEAGTEVLIHQPPDGKDWNDVARDFLA